MRCDIHAHVEIKIDGKWEHYAALSVERDYTLFSKIAGVRDELEPVVPPKGLPEDMSFLTRYDWEEYWQYDGHSCGWLTGAEAHEVEEWYKMIHGFQHPAKPWGYVFGTGFNHFAFEKDVARFPRWTDVRVVFWFDN